MLNKFMNVYGPPPSPPPLPPLPTTRLAEMSLPAPPRRQRGGAARLGRSVRPSHPGRVRRHGDAVGALRPHAHSVCGALRGPGAAHQDRGSQRLWRARAVWRVRVAAVERRLHLLYSCTAGKNGSRCMPLWCAAPYAYATSLLLTVRSSPHKLTSFPPYLTPTLTIRNVHSRCLASCAPHTSHLTPRFASPDRCTRSSGRPSPSKRTCKLN
jgi:hypothetical protein